MIDGGGPAAPPWRPVWDRDAFLNAGGRSHLAAYAEAVGAPEKPRYTFLLRRAVEATCKGTLEFPAVTVLLSVC